MNKICLIPERQRSKQLDVHTGKMESEAPVNKKEKL